jgi:hypothetical protein
MPGSSPVMTAEGVVTARRFWIASSRRPRNDERVGCDVELGLSHRDFSPVLAWNRKCEFGLSRKGLSTGPRLEDEERCRWATLPSHRHQTGGWSRACVYSGPPLPQV